jgi:hypothetical protein
MAAAEAWARAKGLTCLVLHTRDDREDARAFYELPEGRDFSPYEQGPEQTDLTVVDGGPPSLMDSIRHCRTGG